MKKILFFLLIFLSYSIADTFQYTEYYSSARYKAEKANKPLMVMVALRGCPACEHMEDFVFLKEEVIEYMNENFISVIMHMDEDDIPLRFNTIDAPTFFFINPITKKELGESFTGGKSPTNFLKIVQKKVELFKNPIKDTNSTQKSR